MGVSTIRCVPNSCTSPSSVLNGWPASATSSPMRNTRGSRRISSAIASLTASPYVSSRSLMTPSRIYSRASPGGAPAPRRPAARTSDPYARLGRRGPSPATACGAHFRSIDTVARCPSPTRGSPDRSAESSGRVPTALRSTRIPPMATADDVPAPPAAELSLADAMAYARELQLQGRLQAADELYGRILALAPDYADAWHFRGVVVAVLGRAAEAE